MINELKCDFREQLANVRDLYPYMPEATCRFAFFVSSILPRPSTPIQVARAIKQCVRHIKDGYSRMGELPDYYTEYRDEILYSDGQYILQIIDDLTSDEFALGVREEVDFSLNWHPMVWKNPSRMPSCSNESAAAVADWLLTQFQFHDYREFEKDTDLPPFIGYTWDEIYAFKSRLIDFINDRTYGYSGILLHTGEHPEGSPSNSIEKLEALKSLRAVKLPENIVIYANVGKVEVSRDGKKSYERIWTAHQKD